MNAVSGVSKDHKGAIGEVSDRVLRFVQLTRKQAVFSGY